MRSIVPFAIVALAISCAGPAKRSGSTEEMEKKAAMAMPWFVENPPVSADTLFGQGFALKQNPTLGMKAATQRARDEIAQATRVQVQTLMRDFMSESGIGENAQAIEYTEAVSNQVADATLQGSVVVERKRGMDGTWYVLVAYPLENLRNATLETAKREEALYNEFKAEQGFEALENAISNMGKE